MDRKTELQQELDGIQRKEMEAKLQDLNSLECSIDSQVKLQEAKSHRNIMYGDFIIKLLVAAFVSVAFMYVVVTGHWDSMEDGLVGGTGGNGNFQLLSVLGPLFGLVLSYYFGKSKASANGE